MELPGEEFDARSIAERVFIYGYSKLNFNGLSEAGISVAESSPFLQRICFEGWQSLS